MKLLTRFFLHQVILFIIYSLVWLWVLIFIGLNSRSFLISFQHPTLFPFLHISHFFHAPYTFSFSFCNFYHFFPTTFELDLMPSMLFGARTDFVNSKVRSYPFNGWFIQFNNDVKLHHSNKNVWHTCQDMSHNIRNCDDLFNYSNLTSQQEVHVQQKNAKYWILHLIFFHPSLLLLTLIIFL